MTDHQIFLPRNYSDTDLRNRLAELAARRPRLATASNRLPDDPETARRAAAFMPRARQLLDEPTLTRIQTGRRLLDVSRTALHRLGILSVAWMYEQDERFLRRAESELLAVCSFSDWNPSHYLDTGEMMLGVALAYDWLYDDLSPAARETIADGLWRLGLKTADDDSSWWVTSTNNWGQVCHAGATAAALALAEREPEVAFRVLRRAIHNLPLSMASYAPDGLYPEGPMYWCYGTSFNIVFFILVESALGTSYGLTEHPGFVESVDFMLHATGPGNRFFNFADSRYSSRQSLEMLWFSSHFDRPLPEQSPEAAAFLNNPELLTRDRLSPLVLMFGVDQPRFESSPDALPLDWHGRGGSEFTAFRSDWSPDAWYVAVKGGCPSVSHGHMDVGSFVLEALGQRWAEEGGAEDYHALESQGYNLWEGEQDGKRWDVFRYGVQSHNLPVIDNRRQLINGVATMQVEELGGSSPATTLDLTRLYGSPVFRRVVFENRAAVVISDQLNELPAGKSVRWQMLTRATASIDGGSVLTLTLGGVSLRLTVDQPVEWKVEEASGLLNPWDSPMPDHRRVSFELPVPESRELTWTVRFEA